MAATIVMEVSTDYQPKEASDSSDSSQRGLEVSTPSTEPTSSSSINNSNSRQHTPEFVAAAAPAATEPDFQEENSTTSDDGDDNLLLGFVANVILVIGFCALQGFAVLELNGRDMDLAANATYITAFSCFFVTVAIELFIDLILKRTLAHGRYSKKKEWNVAISLLFVVGTGLDTAGFFLWNQQDFLQEHRVLYASSHTWLLTAILVLLADGSWGLIAELFAGEPDGLDGAANVIFFMGTLIDCIARYVDSPGTPHPELSVARLEFSSSPLMLASAILYVWADILRLRRRQSPGGGIKEPSVV